MCAFGGANLSEITRAVKERAEMALTGRTVPGLLGDAGPVGPVREADAARSLAVASRERDEALARALRSEERERVHQDYWAAQVDRLRQAMQGLSEERIRRQELQAQVLRLQQQELAALRRRLGAC